MWPPPRTGGSKGLKANKNFCRRMSNPIADLKVHNDEPNSHVVIRDAYSFFDKAILKSVAVFVGCVDWKEDLSLLEAYSLPTVVCDPYGQQEVWANAVTTKRAKLMDWLTYLKENGCGKYFVNPKWIEPRATFVGNYDGTRKVAAEVEGETVSVDVTSWENLIQTANTLRGNSKAAEPHFALCKIALPNEEIPIVHSLLSTHHRPSLLYVRWSVSPDDSQLHCEAAGALQTAGYRLLAIHNDYFLYQYTGKDLYSTVSWTQPSMGHPFIGMMVEQVNGVLSAIQTQVEPAADSQPSTEAPASPPKNETDAPV